MICFAGDYVLKKFAGIDILSYLNQTRQEDYVQNTIDVGQASDLIPAVTETVQNFPQLPAGMYSGSISGLLPDGDAPLTIISFPEINSLAFVIGVDGWSPNAVSYLERKKGTDGQAIVSKMRVASNGIVLDIEGQVDADQISGKFTNAISGASGTWKVNAVN